MGIESWVMFMNGISQQTGVAENSEVLEHDWNQALFFARWLAIAIESGQKTMPVPESQR